MQCPWCGKRHRKESGYFNCAMTTMRVVHDDGTQHPLQECWCGVQLFMDKNFAAHFRNHGGVLRHWLVCGLGLEATHADGR